MRASWSSPWPRPQARRDAIANVNARLGRLASAAPAPPRPLAPGRSPHAQPEPELEAGPEPEEPEVQQPEPELELECCICFCEEVAARCWTCARGHALCADCAPAFVDSEMQHENLGRNFGLVKCPQLECDAPPFAEWELREAARRFDAPGLIEDYLRGSARDWRLGPVKRGCIAAVPQSLAFCCLLGEAARDLRGARRISGSTCCWRS